MIDLEYPYNAAMTSLKRRMIAMLKYMQENVGEDVNIKSENLRRVKYLQ